MQTNFLPIIFLATLVLYLWHINMTLHHNIFNVSHCYRFSKRNIEFTILVFCKSVCVHFLARHEILECMQLLSFVHGSNCFILQNSCRFLQQHNDVSASKTCKIVFLKYLVLLPNIISKRHKFFKLIQCMLAI